MPKKLSATWMRTPIYMDEAKQITLKRVSIEGVLSVIPLHTLKDKAVKPIIGSDGRPVFGDYVQTSNNHHIAFYKDDKDIFKARKFHLHLLCQKFHFLLGSFS